MRAAGRNKPVPSGRGRVFHPRAYAARAYGAGLAAALLLAACGGAGAAGDSGGGSGESDSLTLTGAVKADSSADKGGGGSCSWTPALFTLRFASGQMQNSVVVKFDVTVGVGGVGDVDATAPAGGATALTLVATGKAIPAAQGTVSVTNADLTAKHFKGTIEGAFTDGTQITGTWSCTAS